MLYGAPKRAALMVLEMSFAAFLLTWEIVGGVLAAQVVVEMVGPAMSVVELQRLQPEEAYRD